MRNDELPLEQNEDASVVGTELLGILSTDRIHYGLFRRAIWRSVGIRTVQSSEPEATTSYPSPDVSATEMSAMVTTQSYQRKLSANEAFCAAHHCMLPPRTGGHVFRWDKHGQCDDRRPFAFFSDGRLGHIQCLDDLSAHLENLFPLFPSNIGIKLHA